MMEVQEKFISKQEKASSEASLLPNLAVRNFIADMEGKMAKMPDARFGDDAFPLKHTFVDGAYVREIFMPKGMLLTSKIHKVTHPYFIMRGDVSVLTEEGVVRIRAPFNGVTKAGTKRLIYTHEDTTWITVHVTKEKDLKKIEEEIIASDFREVDKEELNVEKIRQIPLE